VTRIDQNSGGTYRICIIENFTVYQASYILALNPESSWL